MQKYTITQIVHRLSPSNNEQVEVTNQIKLILEKIVGQIKKDWSIKLVEALWAYRTAFKIILGMSPYD